MSSINEIEIQVRNVTGRVDSHVERLQRIRDEICQTMNKAQDEFGKTREGQNLVLTLSEALNSLSVADSSLYSLKSELTNYVSLLKK